MSFEAALNWLLGIVLALLVARLIAVNWLRGGAIVALLIVFVALLRFGVLEAAIGVVLTLMSVPTLARSPLGAQLMRRLESVTEPLVDLVRRGTGGRVGGTPAMLFLVLLIIAFRAVALLPALRQQ